VRWPLVEMGELAAEKLVGRFLGHPEANAAPTTLSSAVIERDTVGPPKV
jgi:DNA-binding LacI/PurR family transcriptional regulator